MPRACTLEDSGGAAPLCDCIVSLSFGSRRRSEAAEWLPWVELAGDALLDFGGADGLLPMISGVYNNMNVDGIKMCIHIYKYIIFLPSSYGHSRRLGVIVTFWMLGVVE